MPGAADIRADLLKIYAAALEAVNGRRCVVESLRVHRIEGLVHLVAIGKAAPAMAQGAVDVLGASVVDGLVITRHGYKMVCLKTVYKHHGAAGELRGLTCMEAGHPLPDQHSLSAGQALLTLLQTLPDSSSVVFLISGGTSSLVEVLVPGIGLAELRKINQWLLGSGLPIDAINRVRKTLSCIKGGRLATFLNGRPALCLMISDVPEDDPALIGSGLLAPGVDMTEITSLDLPVWITALLKQAPPLPAADDPCFATVHHEIVANNALARRAAAVAAERLGYPVHRHEELQCGDALETGRALASQLRQGMPGLHIWGGETTVRLPDTPGRGGRCQSLALAAAQILQGSDDIYFLAAGTDGSDGPGEDAGALVDGATLARGIEAGLDAEQCLTMADAGRFLEGSGDLIHTGPTGTNVMDILLGVKVQ